MLSLRVQLELDLGVRLEGALAAVEDEHFGVEGGDVIVQFLLALVSGHAHLATVQQLVVPGKHLQQ